MRDDCAGQNGAKKKRFRMTPTTEGKRIRREVIKLAQANGGYHFGGSFSVVEILLAYFQGRTFANPGDRLIFSKGHGCWPLYVMLRERGFSPLLEGHPKRDPANGVTWTTGSLGHGLPAACGIAHALKKQGVRGRVVCVVGDGDIQAGTFWESALIASRLGLDNLCVVWDANGIQGSGYVHEILPIYEAVSQVVDALYWQHFTTHGHNATRLAELMFTEQHAPTLIHARTIKGAGVSFMEDKPEWHARGMNQDETAAALAELA